MIFVSVGTNEARFDRLLRAIATLQLDEELLIQHGHSVAIPDSRAQLVDFLPFDEMVEAIQRARVVVTHAGVGSVLVALANEKRPVVVPRRKSFGEAVDDHQLQIGRRFAAAGLVTLVEDPEQLHNALAQKQHRASLKTDASSLTTDLTNFLETAIERQPTPAAA